MTEQMTVNRCPSKCPKCGHLCEKIEGHEGLHICSNHGVFRHVWREVFHHIRRD